LRHIAIAGVVKKLLKVAILCLSCATASAIIRCVRKFATQDRGAKSGNQSAIG
jgi:hypothetical protein